MTTLTHTHRVTEVPDYCDCAALVDDVDTTHTEQPWDLLTFIVALIGVAGGAVLMVAA